MTLAQFEPAYLVANSLAVGCVAPTARHGLSIQPLRNGVGRNGYLSPMEFERQAGFA
jgi:hypothetical protein